MLQVIERASVGDSRNQRAELQRRHGNAFTKRTHLADAAQTGVKLMRGKNSSVLAFNAVTGKLAQSKPVRVIADFLETEPASNGLKISVVGMRQRLRKAHVRASTESDGLFTGDDFFT